MLYHFVGLGIVDGAAELIGVDGMADVYLESDVDGKGVAQEAFVGEYAVVGVEVEAAEFDGAMLYVHIRKVFAVYNEREPSTT